MSTRLASDKPFFVVDWDISLSKDRFRFYRALSRLKREFGLHGQMSFMLVLITQDENLARTHACCLIDKSWPC
jgi:hypothetical protein